jgi:hypothetical protein
VPRRLHAGRRVLSAALNDLSVSQGSANQGVEVLQQPSMDQRVLGYRIHETVNLGGGVLAQPLDGTTMC